MADGFIVRRGGKGAEQALAPTITEVSKTETQIVFTIKNNDTSSAVILWEIGDTTPDANSLELAADTTSSNITVTGLAASTAQVIYATANVTGKVKSNVTELTITTDAAPVYTAATGGTTTEYDSGGKRYKSHTFTSNGTFTVTTVGDNIDDRNKVDYLIIAGGGAGGSTNLTSTDLGAGGGGAGGYRTTLGTSGANSSAESKVTVTAQGYTITIGAGGTSVDGSVRTGNNGANSSALGITSTGGGGGGGGNGNAATSGQTGGSGGGGSADGTVDNSGVGTAGQGFGGGRGNDGRTANTGGGGGGGASEKGTDRTSESTNAKGGDGLANLLRTGSNETRAGGGGGGQGAGASAVAGDGGSGGGGKGSLSNTVASQNATVNTGGGGGGGGGATSTGLVSGAGGSGIVVIRYEIAPSV
jgi:hypothetical protein